MNIRHAPPIPAEHAKAVAEWLRWLGDEYEGDAQEFDDEGEDECAESSRDMASAVNAAADALLQRSVQ